MPVVVRLGVIQERERLPSGVFAFQSSPSQARVPHGRVGRIGHVEGGVLVACDVSAHFIDRIVVQLRTGLTIEGYERILLERLPIQVISRVRVHPKRRNAQHAQASRIHPRRAPEERTQYACKHHPRA